MFKFLLVAAFMLILAASVGSRAMVGTDTAAAPLASAPLSEPPPAPSGAIPTVGGFRSPLSYTVGEVLTMGFHAVGRIAAVGASAMNATTAADTAHARRSPP